jgi:hypothetical protein
MDRAEEISLSSKKILGFLLIGGFLLALGLFYIPRRPAFSDEKEFHLPLAQQFYHAPALQVIFGEHYLAANTPLPYIVSTGILKMFGLEPDIYRLRVINLLVYLLTVILLFYGYLKRDILMFVIIAFNVYMLKSAVLYYMADWGILFFCIFLILIKHWEYLPRSVTTPLIILVCLFAIMAQQFYMILPAALLIGALMNNERRINGKLLPYAYISLAIIIVPVLLFVQWGGMTHPNFAGYNPVAFAPTNITAVLAIAGFNLSPYVIYKIVQERKVYWLLALVALLCGWFLTPAYAHYMYEGAIVGTTFRFIDTIAIHTVVGTNLITAVFVYFGLLAFYEIVRTGRDFKARVMQSAAFLFSIVYIFTPRIGERHMIPLIFLLYLMLLPRVINKKLLYLWVAVQVVIGVIYVNHLFHDLSII